MKNVLVIGSNSDLIKPLLGQSSIISFLGISKEEWDLNNILPSQAVRNNILSFKPNHLIFSAAINKPLLINNINGSSAIESLQEHINVNCISILSLILFLNESLNYKLTSVHILSSLYGIYGRKNRLPYSVSKHALEGAIKCLAIELPETLIIGYRPGFFKTKLTDNNLTVTQQKAIIEKIPIGRLGLPEDISKFILNNILDPPFYASGSIINLDGGLTSGGFFEFK